MSSVVGETVGHVESGLCWRTAGGRAAAAGPGRSGRGVAAARTTAGAGPVLPVLRAAAAASGGSGVGHDHPGRYPARVDGRVRRRPADRRGALRDAGRFDVGGDRTCGVACGAGTWCQHTVVGTPDLAGPTSRCAPVRGRGAGRERGHAPDAARQWLPCHTRRDGSETHLEFALDDVDTYLDAVAEREQVADTASLRAILRP